MSSTTVTNHQDSTRSDTTTKDVSREYELQLRFTDSDTKAARNWYMVAEFRCHNLLHVMRQGLFWTTSNIVVERGHYTSNVGRLFADKWRYMRVWELQDFVEHPRSQCHWVAKFTLFANAVNTLSNFRLQDLRHEDFQDVFAWNGKEEVVFAYENPKYASEDDDINCWIDELHPAHGSWWFFPMEALPEYSTLQPDKSSVPERDNAV